uniref:Uncharacterized protein n=1 Tax=Oryza meridionalis TaxID=40149 RepID=A0A0E0DNW5_9ORYZ
MVRASPCRQNSLEATSVTVPAPAKQPSPSWGHEHLAPRWNRRVVGRVVKGFSAAQTQQPLCHGAAPQGLAAVAAQSGAEPPPPPPPLPTVVDVAIARFATNSQIEEWKLLHIKRKSNYTYVGIIVRFVQLNWLLWV